MLRATCSKLFSWHKPARQIWATRRSPGLTKRIQLRAFSWLRIVLEFRGVGGRCASIPGRDGRTCPGMRPSTTVSFARLSTRRRRGSRCSRARRRAICASVRLRGGNSRQPTLLASASRLGLVDPVARGQAGPRKLLEVHRVHGKFAVPCPPPLRSLGGRASPSAGIRTAVRRGAGPMTAAGVVLFPCTGLPSTHRRSGLLGRTWRSVPWRSGRALTDRRTTRVGGRRC